MPKAHFDPVLQELEALESELEPMRVVVDAGADRFRRAPTARANAYDHLASAVHHTLQSARALIEEMDWEQPDETADVVHLLVTEDVVPERLGAVILEMAQFAAEHTDAEGADTPDLYDRLVQGAETLTEYVEYVKHFLKSWVE